MFGSAAVIANPAGQLPAYVMAEAASQPRTATLVVTPVSQGTVTAGIVHGSGDTLDQQSTMASTDPELSPSDSGLAHLAVNLVSRSGYDASEDLARFGIGFVFLHTGGSPGVTEQAFGDRAATALDGNVLLARVGTTATGTLWSTAADVKPVALPHNPGGWQQPLIVLMLAVVFGVFALLAIPIGNTAAPRRRPRRAKNGRGGPGSAAPVGEGVEAEASDQPDADTEVGASPAAEPESDAELEPAYAAVGGHDEEA